MPNWMMNKVCCTGNKQALDKLQLLAAGVVKERDNTKRNTEIKLLPFSFSSIMPYPASEDKNKEGEWRGQYWGTRREPDDNTSVEREDNCLIYYFYTAWSEPVGVIEELVKKTADLKIGIEFEYYEPNVGIAGIKKWSNGELQEDYVTQDAKEVNDIGVKYFGEEPYIEEDMGDAEQ